jgi:hypothetical protein
MILSLAKQITNSTALNNWFLTPHGMRVSRAFAAELNQVSGQLRGMSLLQLGNCGENPWLSSLKFPYKWIISPNDVSSNISLVGSLTKLPIDRWSIDCVIAPLSMEMFARDKNPIEEIDRVLKPMGYVVFLGINPCSFWGAALYCHHVKFFELEKLTLTSSLSVKRTMHQLGYKQCLLTDFYYLPPINNERVIKKCEFINEMGKMIWPFPSGFYCQIFQKYQEDPPRLLQTVDHLLGLNQKPALQAMR